VDQKEGKEPSVTLLSRWRARRVQAAQGGWNSKRTRRAGRKGTQETADVGGQVGTYGEVLPKALISKTTIGSVDKKSARTERQRRVSNKSKRRKRKTNNGGGGKIRKNSYDANREGIGSARGRGGKARGGEESKEKNRREKGTTNGPPQEISACSQEKKQTRRGGQ